MMTFWIFAGIMMLLGVLFVMPAIFRRRKKADVSRKDLNISIYQQRQAELEEEKNSGLINADQYEQARLEMDRTFLSDLSGVDAEGHINRLSKKGKLATLISVVILVPVLATPLYYFFGKPELLSSVTPQNPGEMNQDSMLNAINSLVTKLKNEPNNIEGWRLLGRSYTTLNRMDDAMLAYQKALKLNDKDVASLLAYAELVTSSNQGDPKGFPERLIKRALLVSPDNEKALWLYGVVRYQYEDYEGTLKYWKKLLFMQEKGSEQEAFLNENIQKAMDAMMASSGQIASTGDSTQNNTVADAEDASGNASVEVTVMLGKQFNDQISESDIVFIYAQAVKGPPMPLAVVRKQVAELPVKVTLDDSMAMMPMARISKFKQIKISAHISRSGTANKQSGDLFGTSGPLDLSRTKEILITINQVFP